MPQNQRRLIAAVAAVASVAAVAGALILLIALPVARSGFSPTATVASATAVPWVPGPSRPPTTGSGNDPASVSRIRNVVLILADDLDWKLWNQIPRLKALEQQGTTFTNYSVADSLCCPSRTSILRSQYVHNHQVISNDSTRGGGWPTYRDAGYTANSLPNWLQAAGVSTGLVGKYLNQYPETIAEETTVPAGWDTFVVPTSRGQDYVGFDYRLNRNGKIEPHGNAPADFLNDVLTAAGVEFLAQASSKGEPFFLEMAPFTPHLPSPVAPRHRGSHAGEQAPRDPAFGTAVSDPPGWLAGLRPLGPKVIANLDRTWVRRAESAESVADTVDAVRAELARSGRAQDTLVLVSSDNGFHVGSYRTHRGKRSGFDVDTVVPLVAIGPGIARGGVDDRVASAVDLAPTIAEVLHAAAPGWVDGRSLVPLLRDPAAPTPWRTGVLSESLGKVQPGDPDFQLIVAPPFHALRTQRWLYIESANGDVELYDRIADPYEIANIAATTPPGTLGPLRAQLRALSACAGPTCRIADAMPNE